MLELSVGWGEGWLWLGGSLLVAILGANLAWFFRRPRSGAIGDFVADLSARRFSPAFLQFLRLLYYIGIPFAALLWGRDAVVGRLLGLQRLDLPLAGAHESGAYLAVNWLDWAHDAGWAVTLGAGTWGLLALGWWAYRRATSAAGEGEMVAGAGSSGWAFLREAAYHEVHWAFYRNAPVVALGTYWGAWIGLVLVASEAALNPAWRSGLVDPQRAPASLMRAGLAVFSSVLFLSTGNLWLALVSDWGISWGLAALARAFPGSLSRGLDQARAR